MTPKFQVIDVTTESDAKFTIKTIIIDNARFIGYIFTFKDVSLQIDVNGVGVSYSLEIDFHQDHTPLTLTDSEIKEFEDVGHQILDIIMTDLVATVNAGIDESTSV